MLINGASGGVGTFAVQIAKALGAEVTGVCSTRNVDLVRSIGADHVVDYTQEDFTQSDARYDVMLDIAGTRSWSECARVLGPQATLVIVGSAEGRPSTRAVEPRRQAQACVVAQQREGRVLRREADPRRSGGPGGDAHGLER